MFSFLKRNLNKGFTLTELIVVVAVITIVTLVVFLNYNEMDRSLVLGRSTNALAQEIRATMGMALSASVFQEEDLKGGYGVFFSEGENYYTIFVDIQDKKQYNQEDGDERKRIYFEDSRTIISNIEFFECGSIPSIVDYSIIFIPPDPTIFIGGNNNCAEMEVTVTHTDIMESQKVYLNRVGLIEIIQ